MMEILTYVLCAAYLVKVLLVWLPMYYHGVQLIGPDGKRAIGMEISLAVFWPYWSYRRWRENWK